MSLNHKGIPVILILAVLLASCTVPGENSSNGSSAIQSFSEVSGISEGKSEMSMESSNPAESVSTSESHGSGSVTASTGSSDAMSSKSGSSSKSSAAVSEESTVSEPEPTDLPMTSFEAMYQRALKDEGNPDRILAAMKKAKAGKPVTVVALGGSITERYMASTQDKCYASLVAQWWEKNFPDSAIRFYNAGIGSSSTQMAAHRIADDVLPYDPDFIVVDFAVNDAFGAEYAEYFESTLRRLLNSVNKPGIMLLFFCRNDGTSTQNQQMNTGIRYELPMISWRDAVYPLIQLGTWKWSKVSPDTIHPNDLGHQLAADLIGRYLDDLKSRLGSFDGKVDTTLSEPLTPSRFENAFKIQNTNIADFPENATLISLGGFAESSGTFGKMKYSWVAEDTDEPLKIEVTGRSVILLYRSNDPNGGVASVKVNGVLKGNMDAGYPWDFGTFAIAPYNSTSVSTYTIEIQMTDNPSTGDRGKNGDHSVMQIYQIMIDPS